MAAYDIQKHFSGLRVQTARRRGHNPFATGFEDDSDDDDFRKSRPKTKAPPVAKPVPITSSLAPTKGPSPFARSVPKDDDDDNFLLEVKAQKKAERRPSPAPAVASIAAQRVIDRAAGGRRGSLPGVLSDQKKAAVLAAGPLAYLDDSSDEADTVVRPTRRTARNQSPSPRTTSALRSDTPSGTRLAVAQSIPDKPAVAIPLHTVASPFAGTVSRTTSHVIWRNLALTPALPRNTCKIATPTRTKKPSHPEKAVQKISLLSLLIVSTTK